MSELDIFKEISGIFKLHGANLYLVGGAVRDFLSDRPIEDLDLVTDVLPEKIEEMFSNCTAKYQKFGSTSLIWHKRKVDITTLRVEGDYKDFRHPEYVRFVKDLKEDAKRRDFTINALYLDHEMKVHDFYDGKADLKNKNLKMIGNPDIRLHEDPLRIVRAIRFKTTQDLTYDLSLEQAISKQKIFLKQISFAKILEEAKKVDNKYFQLFIDEWQRLKLDEIIPLCQVLNPIALVDMHCDTLTSLKDKKQKLIKNNLHLDLNKMMQSHYTLQCFALFIKKTEGDLYNKAQVYLDNFENELLENNSVIEKVTCYDDYLKIVAKKKIAALITLEGGEIIEGDLSKLEKLYARGCRSMTLTWNYPNEIGYPAHDISQENNISKNYQGLTLFGKEVVKKMNELGMIIDISHCSHKVVEDVLNISKDPIIASHSNAFSISPNQRNLSDDLIKKIALKGGVIGINFCEKFVKNKPSDDYLSLIVDHINHIKAIAGINAIALGSDFDGIDTPEKLSDASKMNLLYERLKTENFKEDEIEKIFYKNFLRVFKKVCK